MEPSVIRLEGPLTLENVAGLDRNLPNGDVIVDFSAVTRVDSSALALLLAWLRRTKARGSTLELRALPAPLLALARLYGVDTLLPA